MFFFLETSSLAERDVCACALQPCDHSVSGNIELCQDNSDDAGVLMRSRPLKVLLRQTCLIKDSELGMN